MRADRYEWQFQVDLIQDLRNVVFLSLEEFQSRLVDQPYKVPEGQLIAGG